MVPGVGYVLGKLEQFGRWLLDLPRRRALKKAVAAWGTVDSQRLFSSLADYYDRKGVPLFSYPGSATRIPVYVRPSWLALTEASLVMTHAAAERPAQLQKGPQQFLALYPEVRKALNLALMWNGRIFRLVELDTSGDRLRLHFEHGRFFDALALSQRLRRGITGR